MQTAEIRQIVIELPIEAPVDRVWKAILDELPEWWPLDFLCYPESEKIRFEPWAGGRLYEETPDGRQILWSNVLCIVPGQSIDFIGYMTPNYGGPSLTMIKFEVKAAEGGGTRFRLVDAVVGRVDDEQEKSLTEGWNYLVASLKEYSEANVGVA